MNAPDHKAVNEALQRIAFDYPSAALVIRDHIEKLRQRCEVAETWLRRVVDAHTGENVDGCDMRNSEIAAIDRAGGGESLVEIVGGEE